MDIIRGDNKTFKFQRKDSTGVVIETPADEVFFTVKSSSYQNTITIQKKLSDGTIIFDAEDFYYRFEILPVDTNNLPFGIYEYDIERIYDDKKQTIAIGTFEINKEITFATNETE